LEFKIKYNTEK